MSDHAVRVLIADDHAPTRDDMRRALEADPRFVVCAEASDAAQAVQAALREGPEICLLDIRMPGNGIAAAWEIRARRPETKIVMLTVSEEDVHLFGALRAGAIGYLLKTMNLGGLPDVLEGVLAGEAAMQPRLVARVLESFHDRGPQRRHIAGDEWADSRLTSREWEVLELLAAGDATAKIAQRLGLSRTGVRVHVSSIVRKLGVPDRAAAISLFRRRSER